MFPDLGKYAVAVLSAYGVALAVLIGLVWLSITQDRKARKALKQLEGEGSLHK
ncbi:heme exporter protein CcmD [Ketogulonicigenium robustum]|uniref:Heme exporter protein D n=1 Tax=Ketogulonicigenium robustum TaxID=92947 RepID=A0A1W6NZ69_9RHOB|nr:heme exporter protein CcmD [Ketogulonicigenium robustum]ARO14548.1 heme exporter protein CcmD [Ketogulonicigenium robustum]